MTERCDQAQESLADEGIDGLSIELRQHVAGCEACSDVLLALVALDAAFVDLPVPARPPGLDARVIDAVRQEAVIDDVDLEPDDSVDETWTALPWWRRRPPTAAIVGAAAMLVVVSSLSMLVLQTGGKVKGLFETADSEIDTIDANLHWNGPEGKDRFVSLPSIGSPAPAAPMASAPAEAGDGLVGLQMDLSEIGGVRGGAGSAGRLDRGSDEWKAMDPDGDGIRRPGDRSGKNYADVFRPETRRRVQRKRNKSDSFSITKPSGRRSSRGSSSGSSARQAQAEVSIEEPEPMPEPEVIEEEISQPITDSSGSSYAFASPTPSPQAPVSRELRANNQPARGPAPPPDGTIDMPKQVAAKKGKKEKLAKEAAAKGLLALIGTSGESAEGDEIADLLMDAEGLKSKSQLSEQFNAGLSTTVDSSTIFRGTFEKDKGGEDQGRFDEGEGQGYRLEWLEGRSELDVATVPSAGYWANTYVPGDPSLRRLESRVRSRREQRGGLSVDPKELDLAVRQVRQPFDPPTDGALGVYLHADRRGITGPTRMRIQVGLQGTERRSGRRPAMNVGVVLDLRGGVSASDANAMRALVEALVRAKDLGDTFSLTVAGKQGGQIVPAVDFRYGPVRLAMESLFGEDTPEGENLGLQAAVMRAIDSVGSTDDPNRPLGSSVVLLVSPGDLGRDIGALEAMAHRSAVSGIPVSVVGVGTGADLPRLETIALAGQGNRRVLPDSSHAEAVVDRELSAASRVVARAVRLRIRLAPGVELVEVLGSDNLDAARSQQVRDAEQSIDRRLARNLGIQADRGDDEAGIQMVIPTWYAGDGHAILLDVIAPGPGAIADVTVKYKDLVQLDNGVARASLHLGRDPRPPGPLELNVLKNEVAHYLSGELAKAADEVANGRAAQGGVVVSMARAWLEQLVRAVPAFRGDRELVRDHTLLLAYERALQGGNSLEDNRFLDDSLRLAARRKVLAPLADDSEGAP
jgi:hypothetical protein